MRRSAGIRFRIVTGDDFWFVTNTIGSQCLDGKATKLGLYFVVSADNQATLFAGERMLKGEFGAASVAFLLHVLQR